MPAFATSVVLGTPSSCSGDPVSTTAAIGTGAAVLEVIGAGAADSLSRKVGDDVDDGATIAATARPPMSAAATAPAQRDRTRLRLRGCGARRTSPGSAC